MGHCPFERCTGGRATCSEQRRNLCNRARSGRPGHDDFLRQGPAASLMSDSRKYPSTADESHRPKTWMRHSLMPARAISCAPVTRGECPVMRVPPTAPAAPATRTKAAVMARFVTCTPKKSGTSGNFCNSCPEPSAQIAHVDCADSSNRRADATGHSGDGHVQT